MCELFVEAVGLIISYIINDMKKIVLFSAAAMVAAMFMGSCAHKSADSTTADEAETVAALDSSLVGVWNVAEVFVNDSTHVSKAEVSAEDAPYFEFSADGGYFISTGCNTIAGEYTFRGDSITLGAGMMTRMACPDMRMEDYISRVIPKVKVAEFRNDSVLTLNTDSASYILLQRASSDSTAVR